MDWYRHEESGAVFWQEGDASEVYRDDQKYDNIGSFYTENLGDGLYITHYQNNVTNIIDISESKYNDFRLPLDPDAYGWSVNMEAGGIYGGDTDLILAVTFLVGPDADETHYYQSTSHGLIVVGGSVGGSFTRYTYGSNDKSNFSRLSIAGKGVTLIGVNIGKGASLGVSYNLSHPDKSGVRTSSVRFSAGFGLGFSAEILRKTNTTLIE